MTEYAFSFTNPIVGGDYPDPSILRVGTDYYMTHSSFEYVPGLLIWHSRNLIDWQPICYALNEYVGSVWAPDFVRHNDTYYIYFPAAGSNWVVTSKSPEGPWNAPMDLGVGFIDPGHAVSPDGKRYLHLSEGNIVSLSEDGLKTSGSVRTVYDGWPIPEDWRVECFCLEGPKIIEKDGWYYLISAQGGTAGPATSHMAVVARSKNPDGPWQNSPFNPLIHTESPDERWWSCGHGTLFDTPDGRWYCVYHAYDNGYHTLGRQTLLEPIEWTPDGWPVRVKGVDRAGGIEMPISNGAVGSRSALLSDDFSGDRLGLQWRFWQNYDPGRFEVGNGRLSLSAVGDSVATSHPVSCIPSDHSYEVEVDVEAIDGCEAAVALFYSGDAFAGVSMRNGGGNVLRRGTNAGDFEISGRKAKLRLVNDRHEIDFFVSDGNNPERKLPASLDTSAYHHNAFGGFLSLRIALCAFGKGYAEFKNFRYSPIGRENPQGMP